MTERLNPRSAAPDLSVPLVRGGEFTLADSKPDKFTILVVYRGVHCPKCKAQLQDIDKQVKDAEARGFKTIAVSMNNQADAEKAVGEWELENLQIGYDLPLLTAKAYGLFLSDSISDSEPRLFTEPGIFVIRPDGALYAEYIQNTPFGRVPFKEILDGMSYAADNDYPTRGTSIG